MRTKFIALGCWLAGIVIVLALYLVTAFTNFPFLILAAIVLAALDAKRIRIWRYQSDIAVNPRILFMLMVFLGWLILPWYLALRFKIMAGIAPLKYMYRETRQQVTMPSYPVSESGLLQPWKRR